MGKKITKEHLTCQYNVRYRISRLKIQPFECFQVEDRRVQAEKELLSMKVKHEALEKRYQWSLQSLHRLKVRVVIVICYWQE